MMDITSLIVDFKQSMHQSGFTHQMSSWRLHHVTKCYQAVLTCFSMRELVDSVAFWNKLKVPVEKGRK